MLHKKLSTVSHPVGNYNQMAMKSRPQLDVFNQLRSSGSNTPDSSFSEDELITALDKSLFIDATRNHEVDPDSYNSMNSSGEMGPQMMHKGANSIFGNGSPLAKESLQRSSSLFDQAYYQSPSQNGSPADNALISSKLNVGANMLSDTKTSATRYTDSPHSSTCMDSSNMASVHSSDYKNHQQLHASNTSIFSAFAPSHTDGTESPRGIARAAPKLNAQTLFAFGVVSTISS